MRKVSDKIFLVAAAVTKGTGPTGEVDCKTLSVDEVEAGFIVVVVSSEVGTATLDIRFKGNLKDGTEFVYQNTSLVDIAIPQITAAGTYCFPISQLGRSLTPAYTIGGANAADGFTVGIYGTFKS